MIQRSVHKIKDEFVLARLIRKPPFEVNPESLNGEARILYVVRGKSILRTATSTINVSEGDCVIVSSGNIVNNWVESEDTATAEVIVFRLFPQLVESINSSQSIFAPNRNIGTAPAPPAQIIRPNAAIKKYIDGLQFYFDRPELLKEELIAIKVSEFLFLLITLEGEVGLHPILRSIFNKVEHKFSEVIDAHIFANISLDELAHLAGLSLSSFNRKFRKVYKESPKKYILTKRLEKARDLLSQSELRVSEIALDCCFDDPANFSKAFSAQFGLPPSAYRKSIMA